MNHHPASLDVLEISLTRCQLGNGLIVMNALPVLSDKNYLSQESFKYPKLRSGTLK
jgi:hypothetical protein